MEIFSVSVFVTRCFLIWQNVVDIPYKWNLVLVTYNLFLRHSFIFPRPTGFRVLSKLPIGQASITTFRVEGAPIGVMVRIATK